MIIYSFILAQVKRCQGVNRKDIFILVTRLHMITFHTSNSCFPSFMVVAFNLHDLFSSLFLYLPDPFFYCPLLFSPYFSFCLPPTIFISFPIFSVLFLLPFFHSVSLSLSLSLRTEKQEYPCKENCYIYNKNISTNYIINISLNNRNKRFYQIWADCNLWCMS